MPNVPPPASGLGSNSNYFLNNNGKSINDVSTTIALSTAIAASAGFGFQLNAYSPDNETCAIQQYVIVVDTTGLSTPSDSSRLSRVSVTRSGGEERR